MWNLAVQNFLDCTPEQQMQTPPPSPSSLLDNDTDIDAIWELTMDNFNQCKIEDSGLPDGPCRTSSSSDAGSVASVVTPSSPSSSSYVPSPRRKKSKKSSQQRSSAKEEVRKSVFEDRGYDEDEDEPWEQHGNLGLTLCSLSSGS